MRIQDFRGYTPTVYVPIPEWSRGMLEAWLLIDGDDPFEKLPRAIPYMIVPLGAALLLFRFVQATIGILRRDRDGLIVSHEAEDAIAEIQAGER
jgi:C4-dicarboxylate transporter DctQ subunit